jgi:foldase protein PrsA
MAVTAVLAGCSNTTKVGGVAVQVGQAKITNAAVNHWIAVMAVGHAPQAPSKLQALREKALDFLISSTWLLGEAEQDGITPSAGEVQRQVAKKQAAFTGGRAEFDEYLKLTGQTRADLELQSKTELAEAKIRQMAIAKEPKVTPAQILAYYKRHRQRYTLSEMREVETVNRKTVAEAVSLKREVQSGSRSFASVSLRNSIALSPRSYDPARGKDAALAIAIHSATPGVLVGPVKEHVDYYLFEVKRIVPSRERPFAEVKSSIAQQLASQRQRRALVGFIAAWRARWSAMTDCRVGYVVRKCRDYHSPGASPSEDPYSFS